ncbi:unnamed protein product [Ambrosiozyma monospora]|uniref:Unnamed protein product n=1 Tax=Ambrosiozyma monospora TaxID=43982 RepID=A0ACB5SVJ6_AMBMO|nr:unnamed protein product [Ambrosiozyma monospora]
MNIWSFLSICQVILAIPVPSQIPKTSDTTQRTSVTSRTSSSIIGSPSSAIFSSTDAGAYSSYVTFKVMYTEFMNNLEYYSSVDPGLYQSVVQLTKTTSGLITLYDDPVPSYLLHQYIQDYVSLVPSSKMADFHKSISGYIVSESTTITPLTTPHLTTPTVTSWDTDITLSTSGANAGLYVMARCKALADDCRDYPGWYNTFLSTVSQDNEYFFSRITQNIVYSLSDGSSLPLSSDNFSLYEECIDYVDLIHTLPWKQRVLAAAKIHYQDYSIALTEPFTVSGYTTLDPNGGNSDEPEKQKNYMQPLSAGICSGIVIGSLFGSAMLIFMCYSAYKYLKRSKSSDGVADTNIPDNDSPPAFDDLEAPPPTYQQASKDKLIDPVPKNERN